MTLVKLSEISGVSVGYLCHLEKGSRRNPSIEIMEKISKALNTTKKSKSNGVLELEFVGSKDTYSVTKETCRSVFGTSSVRSQFYDVIPDNAVTAYNLEEETKRCK